MLSSPLPETVPELILPVLGDEVAFVEPVKVVLDPLHIVTSVPALTVGDVIPVPLTGILSDAALVLAILIFPL